MKISVLKRIEAWKLPEDQDVEVTEDDDNVIVKIRIPKNSVDALPAPAVKEKATRKRRGSNLANKDLLATFTVRTPLDDGPQTITMGKESVTSDNLRSGVVALLAKCNIKPELVSAYPESEGRSQILKILAE